MRLFVFGSAMEDLRAGTGGLFVVPEIGVSGATTNIAPGCEENHSSFSPASPQKQDKRPKRMAEHQQSQEER
jgi:hypothetical protein